MNFDTDHIPAPADHAPRKETVLVDDAEIIVAEVGSETAWLQGEARPVER